MKKYVYLLVVLLFSACAGPTPFTMDSAADQLCNCYSQASGSNFDQRLRPCLVDYVKQHQEGLSQQYFTKDVSSEAEGNAQFAWDITLKLIHQCDSVYQKIQSLNTGRYKLDDPITLAEEIKLLNDSMALDSSIELLHQRAELYIQSGDMGTALTDLDSVLAVDPQRWQSLWAKGYILEAQNDWEGAIHCYELIVEISDEPNHKIFLELARASKQKYLATQK